MVKTKPPLLSAEWVNARIENIFLMSMNIYAEILSDLTYSGYFPLEAPPSKEFLSRLTPEVRAALGLAPLPSEQVE